MGIELLVELTLRYWCIGTLTFWCRDECLVIEWILEGLVDIEMFHPYGYCCKIK
jgi:acyl-ACP thioesterase